jgi:cytochrome c-type biogenesis protein CcmH/NrfG
MPDLMRSFALQLRTQKHNFKMLQSSAMTLDCVLQILTGKNDPGPPIRKEVKRERTYKTKAESDEKKTVSVTVVGTLLVISVVVPMLQYYGYTSKD